jgi:hypothetical protein
MSRYEITLEGKTPLIQHSDRLADPLDEATKEMKKVSSKRVKTEADHALMSWLEFKASLYFGADGQIVVPASNLVKALVEGARVTKSGPKVERGVTVQGIEFPLDYEGPTTPEGLYADASFVDRRSVKVGQSKVMRTRPLFSEWGVTFEVLTDDAICGKDDVIDIATNAGNLIGLMDNRKNGYGRFTAEVVPL